MHTNKPLTCFKAYDIRGKLDDEIDEHLAYRIGQSTAKVLGAKSVIVGFDARETSPKLAKAVAQGVCHAGSDVLDIGLAGTEEMYWSVSEFDADAGIEVTASHNPIEYNGMKIVKANSEPLSNSEFLSIRNLTKEGKFSVVNSPGLIVNKRDEARYAYIKKIISFINLKKLTPLKIVINSGNGAAGPVINALKRKLEKNGVTTNFIFVHHNPDSSFPNGIPNPLLKENRSKTADVVIKEGADFGVAFDGDFDRCFLFDHLGNFIPGEYFVGLLAKVFLQKYQDSKVIYDPRVVWNTLDVVNCHGGLALASKTGHVFIKRAMRDEDAIYGGEMSAHHYFRNFAYCDSGMIPWLMVWELLSSKKTTLYDLIDARKLLFPSSGEINFKVADASNCIKILKDMFADDANSIDELDGLSVSFKSWRFNVRKSNTEPLVRLNVETRGDEKLLNEKIDQLRGLILRI